MKLSAGAVIVACASIAVPCAMGQETAVTPKEITDQWVGKSLDGITANGGRVTMVLGPDGTAQLSGAVNDAGTWRVSENGNCTTWNRIRSGQERCFTARRDGTSITVLNPDGTLSGTFTGVK